jgi:phosphatidylserine synthase 2
VYWIDDSLEEGIKRTQLSYDDNCEFVWENIADNMDFYFYLHAGTWFCVSFILRDYYILHLFSILDEVLELSLQHMFDHFRECWWDHILLDVLLTNTTGIIIGMKFQQLVGIKQYDWLGRKGAKSIKEWKVWTW